MFAKSFLIIASLLISVNFTSAQPTWLVNLNFQANGSEFTLSFGGSPTATDDFDNGLDQLAPPAPPTPNNYYSYFLISGETFTHLSQDIRCWVSPFESNINWKVVIENAEGIQTTITWDPNELPEEGYFNLLGLSNYDMRTTNSINFTGNKTLTIQYRFMTCRETTLNLAQGWSWISLNVYPPDDPNMEVVWQDVNSLVIIKGYSGFYIPGEWNGIGDWQVKEMYVPYLSSPEQLSMCGQPVEPSTPIALSQNWNWVGYLPNIPIDAVVALSSIVNDLNICKGYGGFYIPGEWNGIGNMEPGQGYKMHMGQAGTLIYPPGSLLLKTTDKEILSKIESIPSKHFTCTQSAEYQAILIKKVNGDEVQVGDEVGAFTESGKCIGAGVYNGSFPIAIMAWSDVKDTEEIEGYRLGEKMHFRLWENSEGREIELTYNVLQGSDKYGESPLNKVELTKQAESLIPKEFSLEQNYPNPFNPETFIRYNIAKASKVRLAIYSINGKLIRLLEDSYKEAGGYQTLWDGRNEFGEKVATGLYFCHIQAAENKAVRKIILVK